MEIYILFILSSFILSLFELNNKKIKPLAYIPIIIGICIYILNETNLDYQAYLNVFNSIPDNYLKIEEGFYFFMKIIKKLNLSYQIIPVSVGVFFFYTFFFAKDNRRNNQNMIFFPYILYHFLYDITQIRNVAMISFVYNGIKQEQRLKSYIFNLLGILCHKLGIIYLFFFLIEKIELKKYIKIIISIYLLGIFAVPTVKFLGEKYWPEKLGYYFNIKLNYGFLFYYILIILDLIIIYFSDSFKNKKTEKLLKFFLFSICFLPFSIISIESMRRIYRNSYLIKMILVTENLKMKNLIRRIILYIFLIIGGLLSMLAEYRSAPEFIIEFYKSIFI